MKTTKKGFTLIELIVVIAIIGVLAAILVPSMLGYVKKSKIQSANSAASTIMKAANSALEEMDEAGFEISAGETIVGTDTSADGEWDVVKNNMLEYMKPYFDGAETAKFSVAIKNGAAVACAAKSGAYYGTTPIAFTNKSYETNSAMSFYMAAAIKKYNATASANSKLDTKFETADTAKADALATKQENKPEG